MRLLVIGGFQPVDDGGTRPKPGFVDQVKKRVVRQRPFSGGTLSVRSFEGWVSVSGSPLDPRSW